MGLLNRDPEVSGDGCRSVDNSGENGLIKRAVPGRPSEMEHLHAAGM
jgi:hypothetical protein